MSPRDDLEASENLQFQVPQGKESRLTRAQDQMYTVCPAFPNTLAPSQELGRVRSKDQDCLCLSAQKNGGFRVKIQF